MRSIARVAQRPLHASIEGNRVKRGQDFGHPSFWLLFIGCARKSNLLSVNHRRGRPAKTGHKIQPRSDHKHDRLKSDLQKIDSRFHGNDEKITPTTI